MHPQTSVQDLFPFKGQINILWCII